MLKTILINASLFLLVLSSKSFAQDLQWENISREISNIQSILIHPDNAEIIFIGTSTGVFRTQNHGGDWQRALAVKGTNSRVNFLAFGSQDKDSLYAATGNGLYYSANSGKSWQRIFRGKDYLQRDCQVVAVLPYGIFLGTKNGLFRNLDKGRSWQREDGQLGRSQILAIAYSLQAADDIYVASMDGIFRSKDKGSRWEVIFTDLAVESYIEDADPDAQESGESRLTSNIRYITVDPQNPSCLYLGTSRGVYRSDDKGDTWKHVSDYGLLSREVNFLLSPTKSELYAVTIAGAFKYEESKWKELTFNLTAQVQFLSQDQQGDLYLATQEGLFKSKPVYSGYSGYKENEPAIESVQQAAVRYAEVEPEKINRWRRQAARKAWLPTLTVGADRNTTDLWHWEGGSTTKVDDDTLRRGRASVAWDVSVSWDLGELIWNDDQTSIDVRSRLMVELRDNILDEVTKLYFERIRVKMELDNLSIEEKKRRVEKELKIRELTASLDALTGGFFSRKLREYAKN